MVTGKKKEGVLLQIGKLYFALVLYACPLQSTKYRQYRTVMSSGERTLFFSVLVPCLLDFGMREVPAVNTGRARRKKEKDEAERGERSSKASKGTRQKKSGKGKQKEHNQCTRGCVCVSVYKN